MVNQFKEDTGHEITSKTMGLLANGERGFTGDKAALVKKWIISKTLGKPEEEPSDSEVAKLLQKFKTDFSLHNTEVIF